MCMMCVCVCLAYNAQLSLCICEWMSEWSECEEEEWKREDTLRMWVIKFVNCTQQHWNWLLFFTILKWFLLAIFLIKLYLNTHTHTQTQTERTPTMQLIWIQIQCSEARTIIPIQNLCISNNMFAGRLV